MAHKASDKLHPLPLIFLFLFIYREGSGDEGHRGARPQHGQGQVQGSVKSKMKPNEVNGKDFYFNGAPQPVNGAASIGLVTGGKK